MYRLLLVALLVSGSAQAQIKKEAVASFLQAISADSMMGRLPGTAGIDKAANLIAAEFKGAGLPFMTGLKSYYQEFPMVKSEVREATVTVDGEKVEATDVMVLGEDDQINWKAGDAEKIWIEKGTNLGQKVFGMTGEKGNKIVFADTSNRRVLRRFKSFGMQRFGGLGNIVVVLTTKDPSAYDIKVSNNVTRTMFRNVVAMIPGKRTNEFVIFSGHYDHLGSGKAVNGDTIFNGANDDASGTTAVVTLAKFYAKQPKPERTLLFVAFTAEETGGYGATYFSKQLPPEQVIAMFNIEMIGTDSKWGKNTAYITGYDKSDMGALLQENLKGTQFMFHPDPYPAQNLFYRSDNATLARLGVPAHTISTSKMDSEKYYHTVDDEFETLDMDNMTEIIKAIAESSKGIISGKQTPSRVKPLN
ncbi:MAG: M28 family peptidase [Chitinophagaceae bacterium]